MRWELSAKIIIILIFPVVRIIVIILFYVLGLWLKPQTVSFKGLPVWRGTFLRKRTFSSTFCTRPTYAGAPPHSARSHRRLLETTCTGTLTGELTGSLLRYTWKRRWPGSMAKWGEGDPRWIVEERADATNVNNWHWWDGMRGHRLLASRLMLTPHTHSWFYSHPAAAVASNSSRCSDLMASPPAQRHMFDTRASKRLGRSC